MQSNMYVILISLQKKFQDTRKHLDCITFTWHCLTKIESRTRILTIICSYIHEKYYRYNAILTVCLSFRCYKICIYICILLEYIIRERKVTDYLSYIEQSIPGKISFMIIYLRKFLVWKIGRLTWIMLLKYIYSFLNVRLIPLKN